MGLDIGFWRTLFQDERSLVSEDEFDLMHRWEWINTPSSEQFSVVWANLYGEGSSDDLKGVSNVLAMRCLESDEVGVRYFISNLGDQGVARSCIEVGDQIQRKEVAHQ